MKPDPARCAATRKDGEPCGAFAVTGSQFCYAHGNSREWREAAARGGESARAADTERRQAAVREVLGGGSCEDLDLRTAEGVKSLLAECLRLTREGRMDPRIGNSCATLANSMRAYFELVDIETRLAALEQSQTHNGG